ncbi:MAG: ABC transporter permease [Acidobacteriaceae bacterium]|jgi:putative ABC transport system permease protein|nr:ABC transporter permease [Acidobacteriaceae bacterium]
MIWNAILLALSAIRRNVLRSVLTVLGVIIGVAAVIAMVTIGNGATASVAAQINTLGENVLTLTPGQQRGSTTGLRAEAKLFEESDVEAVNTDISGARSVAPTASKSMQAIYANANWSTTVYGVDNAYFDVRNWTVQSGREFTDAEIQNGGAVCIIGTKVSKQLFADQDPVGANIRLQAISCQVIGLLATKGQGGMGMDQDDLVLVPLHTFQRRISGDRKVSTIQIGVRSDSDTKLVQNEVVTLMRQRRGIQPGQEDDFTVINSQEFLTTLTSTMQILTALLGAIAAISLLVGGIGIMNIMLVSVTERTREIGIRLAIGAFDNDVMVQFLVEAIVLASLGGIIGIGLGLGASFVGCLLMKLTFLPDLKIAAIAFVFSALVGVIFGFYPAQKAARLDPIEALRHE